MADNTYSKILESLDRLIAAEETLDMTILNPAADLTAAALTAQSGEGSGLHNQVGVSKGLWRTAALDRATDVDKFPAKAAQAVALFEAQGASREKMEDARFYVRKLQGKRATAPKVDDPATPDIDESEGSISASQQSSAAKISMFNELLDFLEPQPEYAGVTNAEFKINTLRAFSDAVSAKHNVSITTAANLSGDRIDRDKVFFDNPDSIITRAKRFKKTVGGSYGFNSPEYKLVNAIKFKSPKKK